MKEVRNNGNNQRNNSKENQVQLDMLIDNAKRRYVLYVHELPTEVSGKDIRMKYVGITSQKPEKRWQNGHGYCKNEFFFRAINKYGWENFDHFIIERNLSLPEAVLLEKHYIQLCRSYDRNFGYNHTLGGEGGLGTPMTEENKRKQSLAKSGENSPTARRMFQFDFCFRFINKYGTIKQASKETSNQYSSIVYAAKNKATTIDSLWLYEEDVEYRDGTYHIKDGHHHYDGSRHKVVYVFDAENNFLFLCLGIRTASEITGIKNVTVKRCAQSCGCAGEMYKFRYYKDVVEHDDGTIEIANRRKETLA